MRELTSGGVRLRYPDAVGFAFNPCLVVVTGESVEAVSVEMTGADGSVVKDERNAFDGGCYADLREYVQGFFDTDTYGDVKYDVSCEKMPQGQRVLFEVMAGGAVFDFSVFYVWGAMKSVGNDVYNGKRTLTAFIGYPFTFGAYLMAADTLTVKRNGSTQRTVEISAEGVWNVPMSVTDVDDVYVVTDSHDNLRRTTFDETFDLTFRMAPNENGGVITVKVGEDIEDGMYLRWIDRHGFYRYWLFKKGGRKMRTGNEGQFLRNNIIAADMSYGYQGGLGRQMIMTRGESVPVCASLIDSDTWDVLADMASSPFVDLFTGYVDGEARWISVQVQAGTFTKDRSVLQDFEAEIVLPDVPIQRL